MSFDPVLRMYQRINTLARSIIDQPAFDDVHVQLPDPARPETGFIRATSWLYCLYFETGRVSITYLLHLGQAYNLVNRDQSAQHMEAVRSLRTELHHNLGFADSDLKARNTAGAWRRKACGTAVPCTDEHWSICYNYLISDASTFLDGIDAVLRRVELDGEDAQMHIDNWLHRLNRSWAAAAFDSLIDDVKYRLGYEALNTVTFRNRHIDRWRKQLDLLVDNFDFDFETTRLIEKTLLDDDSSVLPITGRDIIDTLQIKPGPQVAKLLEEAKNLFQIQPCNRDDLLAQLKGKLDCQRS